MTSSKNEHSNFLQQSQSDWDRALIESAEQFKSKLIVEYQKFETLNDKYREDMTKVGLS
jgi:hypothetical protein